MKKLTIFETSIIGFFTGVVAASYLAFLSTTDGALGSILELVSLKHVFGMLNAPAQYELVLSFLFTVAVFTVYGAIIGAIAGAISKPKYVAAPLAIIVAAAFGQQIMSTGVIAPSTDASYQAAAVVHSMAPAPAVAAAQSSATEARGDMNADDIDDTATLIKNESADGSASYFVSVALSSETGQTETSSLELGNILPRMLSIDEGILIVEYTSSPSSSALEYLYAQMDEGSLVKTEVAI